MQSTIAFVSYQVTNLNRAVKFYQKVLGKEPLFHKEDWAEFEDEGLEEQAREKINNKPKTHNATEWKALKKGVKTKTHVKKWKNQRRKGHKNEKNGFNR